jgi:hypothetical protein
MFKAHACIFVKNCGICFFLNLIIIDYYEIIYLNFVLRYIYLFSNIWTLEFVIIRLVSSAYRTRFDISDITFGISFTYKRKSKGPSIDPCGTQKRNIPI